MGLFSKKEKKFPKVIIVCGMPSVGKSTLCHMMMPYLVFHNYLLSNESLSIEERQNYANHVVSKNKFRENLFLNKLDYKRINNIVSILDEKNKTQNLIYDGLVLNYLFYKFICKNNDIKKIIISVVNKFEYLIDKFNLNDSMLNEILFLHITNENGKKYYLENKRGDLNEVGYEIIYYKYNKVISNLSKYLKRRGIHYRKVDITKLKLNNEDSIRKFISKNLLVKK